MARRESIAEVRAERDHYKELAEKGLDPLVKSMRFENGEINMEVAGPIVEMMAAGFVGQFKAGGAKNYMEMSLFDRDEPYQRYVLTFQKVGEKSPADLVNEARKNLEDLTAEYEQLRTVSFNRGALLDEIGRKVWEPAAARLASKAAA